MMHGRVAFSAQADYKLSVAVSASSAAASAAVGGGRVASTATGGGAAAIGSVR